MLPKTQKIWLWISGAMFLVPEILWGNLLKIFKISFLPIYKNVQIFTDNPSVAFLIIITEIIGVSGIIYLLNKKDSEVSIKFRYVSNILLVIILLILLISLYLSYGVSQINF